MNNQYIDDSTWEKRPEPTWSFILNIAMCLAFSISGCAIALVPFFSDVKEGGIEVISLFVLFGLSFLSAGIYFFLQIIKQIKLRISWNKQKNIEIQHQKLTTREANLYQLATASNPDYHDEAIDKALGVKYESKLIKDKYGNVYFQSKTRYGGFYYLGSLITVIAFTAGLIACILGIIEHIKNKDFLNIVLFFFLILLFVFIDFYAMKELIFEFKEKREVKRKVREGKLKKEKMGIGAILYRIVIYLFLFLFLFMLFGIFAKEMGHSIPAIVIEYVLIVSFALLFLFVLIIELYSYIIKFLEYRRRK